MPVTATVCHSVAELGVVTVTVTTVTKTPCQDKCEKEGATQHTLSPPFLQAHVGMSTGIMIVE